MALLAPGTTIRDTYDVERLLGEGAFAEVYRVKHRFLGRQAMKVFKRGGMTLEEVREALSEALILSQLRHPNIIHVFDANLLDTGDGIRGYFTMELVAGGSLDKFWQSHGRSMVPVATVVDIISQVCRGLGLAHRESPPIIHRDIKPQNILIGYETEGLRARVSDFGLAKQVNPLTLLATAAGTLAFKPPEAFGQDGRDSAAADVWALGVTLYLLLSDQLPFKVDVRSGWESQTEAWKRPLVPPSNYNVDVSKELDATVLKCLQRDPSKRYANANELLAALTEWRPVVERQPSSEPQWSQTDKSDLGPASAPNWKEAERLAGEALKLARTGSHNDAADMMEEAMNKWPTLRDKYASKVRLWRCGIVM